MIAKSEDARWVGLKGELERDRTGGYIHRGEYLQRWSGNVTLIHALSLGGPLHPPTWLNSRRHHFAAALDRNLGCPRVCSQGQDTTAEGLG